MTDKLDAVRDHHLYAFENRHTEHVRALGVATDLLAEVRSRLLTDLPALDKVGADALMLNALVIRAGHQRYYWPTLEWLVQGAYDHGHSPYTNPIGRSVDTNTEYCGYNPFGYQHHFFSEVDEDYSDPPPEYVRPLRFVPEDLYKWEAELGTNNQDTHRLYRGEDIDGPAS